MRILFIVSTALFLASCGNDTQPIHDVKYYLDNPDILKDDLEKCRNNPGNFEDTPNCINAEEAAMQQMNESMDRAWGELK